MRECYSAMDIDFDKEETLKRNKNFSPEETEILVKIISKYKHHIDRKKKDKVSLFKKSEAWKSVHQEFNLKSNQRYRSIEALQTKYANYKKFHKEDDNKHSDPLNEDESEDLTNNEIDRNSITDHRLITETESFFYDENANSNDNEDEALIWPITQAPKKEGNIEDPIYNSKSNSKRQNSSSTNAKLEQLLEMKIKCMTERMEYEKRKHFLELQIMREEHKSKMQMEEVKKQILLLELKDKRRKLGLN